MAASVVNIGGAIYNKVRSLEQKFRKMPHENSNQTSKTAKVESPNIQSPVNVKLNILITSYQLQDEESRISDLVSKTLPNLQPTSSRIGSKKSTPQSDLYIFIGLRHSGKSNSIREVFRIRHKNLFASTAQFEVYQLSKLERNERGNNIILIECPGLASYASAEENQPTTSALATFLEANSVTPKFVFVTARLNDNRFAGEYSEFSQALLTIKTIGNLAASKSWENLVMVFTFGDRPDVRNTDFMLKINKYEETVESILGIKPLHRIVLYHHSLNSDTMQMIINRNFVLVNHHTSTNLRSIIMPSSKPDIENGHEGENTKVLGNITKKEVTGKIALNILESMTPEEMRKLNFGEVNNLCDIGNANYT